MIGRARILLAAAPLLAVGCERDDRPLDGGRPLEFDDKLGDAEMFAQDDCARREKGGWHRSVGHCEPMLPQAVLDGVWITAFEENSFFPGEKVRPDPRHPRRFTTEVELDEEEVFRAAGRPAPTPAAQAVYLRFKGRRTRDPLGVDCYGNAYFVYVVDQLIEARHLGEVPALPEGWFEQLARNRSPSTVRQVHGGRWGELEAEAVANCSGGGRGVGADDLESANPGDRSAAEANPAGNTAAK